MVDSSRRRGRRREVMSNHNRCWIWGRNVVLETVRAGRWPILELVVGERLTLTLPDGLQRLIEQSQIPFSVSTDDELTRLCRSADHQGFAARMAPFPCLTTAELTQRLPGLATVVVLDRLQDPFNFGAIVRSASTLGIDGILIGEREQAEVNSQVARSSAGAINDIPIARTGSLTAGVDQWRQSGYQVVAASEKAERSLFEVDFNRSTVVIIGNEGRGVHPDLMSRCDTSVSIPMSGRVGSLNAAVAAGILFYEIRRQRSLASLAR